MGENSGVAVLRQPRQTIVVALGVAWDAGEISAREKDEALAWMNRPDGCDSDRHVV